MRRLSSYWTKTPWTLPGNRAISFSHRITYGRYRVTASPDREIGPRSAPLYIVADKLANEVFKSAKVEAYERFGDVSARFLSGSVCDPPLRKLIESNPPKVYSAAFDFWANMYPPDVPLLDGDHVTDDTGTGFVHTAPGHGREDFEIWMANQRDLALRGINTRIPYTVDDDGFFTKEAPGFEGRRVIDDKGNWGDANDAVINALIEAGNLLARGKLKHQYPHSWRSKKPVIFRNTPQWFIALDKPPHPNPPPRGGRENPQGGREETLREIALREIALTKWYPPAAKTASLA